MFIALLGKQLDVRPAGWEQSAGAFAQPDSFRSVADVRDPESLEKVQNAKLARQNSQGEVGDGPPTDGESSHHTESQDSANVTTEEEQAADAEGAEGAEGAGEAPRARRQTPRSEPPDRRRSAAARQGRRAARGAEGGKRPSRRPTRSRTPPPTARMPSRQVPKDWPRSERLAGPRSQRSAPPSAQRGPTDPEEPATKRPGKGRKKAAARRRARKQAAAGGDDRRRPTQGAATESAPDAADRRRRGQLSPEDRAPGFCSGQCPIRYFQSNSGASSLARLLDLAAGESPLDLAQRRCRAMPWPSRAWARLAARLPGRGLHRDVPLLPDAAVVEVEVHQMVVGTPDEDSGAVVRHDRVAADGPATGQLGDVPVLPLALVVVVEVGEVVVGPADEDPGPVVAGRRVAADGPATRQLGDVPLLPLAVGVEVVVHEVVVGAPQEDSAAHR